MLFKTQKGFTLLEILLVVAAVGILAAIVIVAINPNKQLAKVRNAERQSETTTLKKAIEQYAIANDGEYPSDITPNQYREICDTEAVSPSECPSGYVDLSELVPNQIASLPRDPQADNTDAETGYQVTKDKSGNIVVKAPNTEVQSDTIRAGSAVTAGYDLENASYTEDSYYVGNEDNAPAGGVFNNDGSKFFMAGTGTEKIYEYKLNTPYDVSNVSTSSPVASFPITDANTDNDGNSPDVEDITFNGKGDKMFIVTADPNDGEIYEFSLSNNYDLTSTVSYIAKHNVSSQVSSPSGVVFNEDGSKMFISGRNTNKIYGYTVSNDFDLSSNVQFTGNSLNVGNQSTSPQGLRFRGDGTRLYVVDYSEKIYQYNLSSGYDLSIGSYSEVSLDTQPDAVDNITGLDFSTDGTTMIIISNADDSVHEYSTSAEK